MYKPHNHKKMTNSLLMIQLKGASDKLVRGPLRASILDGPVRVKAPSSKYLASVDYISGSYGVGWGQLFGPWILLGKVRSNLGF